MWVWKRVFSMVEFRPSRRQIIINGQVYSVSSAERLYNQIGSALEIAEKHEAELMGDDVNLNESAVRYLIDPVEPENGDTDFQLCVNLSVDGDEQAVPTDLFDSISEDKVLMNSTMRVVTGLVNASVIPIVYEQATGLVSFNVKLPSECDS